MGKERRDHKNRLLWKGESQREDGRYEFKYYDAEGVRRTKTSWRLQPTDRVPLGKRDNGLSLREIEKEIQRDLLDGIRTSRAQEITLNQMFYDYMDSKVELKLSTRTNYKYMYKQYVQDELGNKKITEIKYSDVLRFYKNLIRKKGEKKHMGSGLKLNTLENIHTVLHPVFKVAVRDGYIRTNPTDDVMSEIKKKYKWEKVKRHALTEEQQQAFVDYIAKSPVYKHWLPLITVFLGTGGRVGEIIGLRWEDCDFRKGIISINHNLLYRLQDGGQVEFYIETPKTDSGVRDIPMFNAVRQALLQEKERQLRDGFNQTVVDDYTGFVFKNRDGNVYSPASINRAIKRIYEAYNEEEVALAKKEKREPVLLPHFSVHNLRHTFCTRLCEKETNLKLIQEIMGHADITTTMNIYNEVTQKKKRESFANLEGKIQIC